MRPDEGERRPFLCQEREGCWESHKYPLKMGFKAQVEIENVEMDHLKTMYACFSFEKSLHASRHEHPRLKTTLLMY